MEHLHDHSSASNAFQHKEWLVRAIVGAVCVLSMLGSLFVIFSYCCIKTLRSEARQILINLSLMDFGVGLANFVGIVAYFDGYYRDIDHSTSKLRQNTSEIVDILCKAQAFVAAFSTLASVFWTIALALYMYLLVIANWKQTSKYFYHFAYLSYVASVLMCIWYITTDRLGHAPYSASGWCSLINRPGDYIGVVIGYDIWIYLGMVVCTTVYLAIIAYLTIFDKRREKDGNFKYWKQALQMLDYRLVFIPAFFIFLRSWTCIANITFTYIGVVPKSLPTWLQQAVIILTGIGDSGQGAANGLLFVAFTGVFWKQCVAKVRSCCCCCCKRTRSHNFNSSTLIQHPPTAST